MLEAVIYSGIEYRRYDHLYFVSKCGKLLRKGVPRIPNRHPKGYLSVGKRFVHRMVASVWIRPPAEGEEIHHKDRCKTSNHADNLEWVTTAVHRNERHHDHVQKFAHSPMSEAGKQRLRELRLGTKMPQATKDKIRASMKRNGWHPPSQKGRVKPLSEYAWMFEKHHKWVACVVHGVRYKSFTEAGKALGIRSLTLRKRCHSVNFPEYQLDKCNL